MMDTLKKTSNNKSEYCMFRQEAINPKYSRRVADFPLLMAIKSGEATNANTTSAKGLSSKMATIKKNTIPAKKIPRLLFNNRVAINCNIRTSKGLTTGFAASPVMSFLP